MGGSLGVRRERGSLRVKKLKNELKRASKNNQRKIKRGEGNLKCHKEKE